MHVRPDSSWLGRPTYELFNAVPLWLLQNGVPLRLLWGHSEAIVTEAVGGGGAVKLDSMW